MKRTSLKRKTSLKAKVGLKRTPMKFKPKRFPIPKEELAKVDERADCKCEFHGSRCPSIFLEYAHIKHRKMGGVQDDIAEIINNRRNITKICNLTHDFIDCRTTKLLDVNLEVREGENFRNRVIDILKQKIGWYEWYEENKSFINR